ncbi:MAG: hypothetical protein GY757_21970, partial [bacterium]|nr:hypothetical protein [bacterium]
MLTNIFKFAWRNVLRNKRRTLITVMAIAIGVTSIVFAQSYIKGILNSAVEAIVKTRSGHVKVAEKEYLRMERVMPKEYLVR